MALLDRMKEGAAKARERAEAFRRYDVVVNRGSMNAGAMRHRLNSAWARGWRLSHIFEQHGNTVIIFERREIDNEPIPADDGQELDEG